MAMPVRVMDHWIGRYHSVINKRVEALRDEQSQEKRKLLEEKREEFYKTNGISKLLKRYEKARNDVEISHEALIQSLDFMFNEANKGSGRDKYSYGYSTPNSVSAFKEQFDQLILKGFDKFWEANTDSGKQIKELKNMREHVTDAVFASATPQNLLDGLTTVMKSLNAEVLLNGGSKPLLEELNEVVIKPK
jgi:hypothetical protein